MQSKKSKLIFSKTEQNQFEADKLGERGDGNHNLKIPKMILINQKAMGIRHSTM